MKHIAYKPAARKSLRKMPVKTAKRIISKIEAFAEYPTSQANNVTALKGRTGIRLRVGNWRVIMLDGIVLEILAIGLRGNIYN